MLRRHCRNARWADARLHLMLINRSDRRGNVLVRGARVLFGRLLIELAMSNRATRRRPTHTAPGLLESHRSR